MAALRTATCCLLLASASGFNLGGKPSPSKPSASVTDRTPPPAAGTPAPTGLQDAWDRYVLLRPQERNGLPAYDSLWASRKPGTVRTILLSSAICSVVALPFLLTNPAVLTWLVELAALDRVGVTPQEMLETTGRYW